ncbi:hypothetical protein [Paenibacillus sp.]|uniref:hypothetical protein n=1 Tax=Paenibacillus sp. TaxID=58172 RepID=UPI002D6976A6|nr:hypothetical protein [Paenibacillus sp.]HZG57844.1 hypothetical protein [Paenibacillus sp.]
MLKKLLKLLLSSSQKKHYGGGYKKYSSSDHFQKPKFGAPPKHNQYGHGYYKKKGYSSYSS